MSMERVLVRLEEARQALLLRKLIDLGEYSNPFVCFASRICARRDSLLRLAALVVDDQVHAVLCSTLIGRWWL